jgi:hypothetical protein
MGVYLHMTLNDKKYNLGRSHLYIEPGQELILEQSKLYDELYSTQDYVLKKLNILAAHCPSREELDDAYEEVDDLVAYISDKTARIGRCLTLSEFKEEYGATFEVE